MRVESKKLGMVVECDNDYMRLFTLREGLLELEGGLYDVPVDVPVEGKQVVDVGAYLGETAVYFSKRGAREVYAYEPFSSEDFVLKNAAMNDCHNIKSFRCAVGGSDTDIFVDRSYRNTGSSRLSYGPAKNGETLPQVSLNSIVDAHKITDGILKMDVEGSEFEIIEASDTDTLRAFEYMIIEVHALLGDMNALVNKILSSGFDVTLKDHPIYNEESQSGLYLIYAVRNIPII